MTASVERSVRNIREDGVNDHDLEEVLAFVEETVSEKKHIRQDLDETLVELGEVRPLLHKLLGRLGFCL